MSDNHKRGLDGFATNAVRGGQVLSPEYEQSEPLFLTSSFRFRNAAEAAARFRGDVDGNVYSRFTNPTVRVFEQRLALLEGGESCIATASGMGAILLTCIGLLQSGDEVVASRSIFGTTVQLFKTVLAKFGVKTKFVSLTDEGQWQAAISPATKMLFLESPSNPLTEIADIPRLAELAHANGSLLVVDNCFCTPALQRPLALGADLVIHSATKYLDGQGRCVGGAVIGPRELLAERLFPVLRTAGPSMSPFNAWVFLKGLETLDLRLRAHCASAAIIAERLQQAPAVRRVHHPSLASHPQHALAQSQQSGGGGVIGFELDGGREAAWRVVDGVRLLSITANLGDAKSTITHPASTTHWRLNDQEKADAGISEGLLRISVGLEDVEDIWEDLSSALGA